MYSKMKLKMAFVGVLFCGSALVGCDSNVGEEPPPPNAQEFGGTQCLSDAKPVALAFIQGDAKTRDLEVSWKCTSDAVEKFKRYVRGGASDRYTSQELATFLETNFLNASKNEVISVKLQVEFMKLKKLFIGGSGEYLTRTEIDKLIVLLGNFRDITIRLNPYMKVLSLNWKISGARDIKADARYFEEANSEIQVAARSVASLIEKNEQGYILSDFSVLMEELSIFFGEKWEFPKTIQKYMPIIQKVKKALAGGAENSIIPKEWDRFLILGSRGYVQYMRYYYFIRSVQETGMGYRLSYLASSVDDVLSIFQDLLAEKPEKTVTTQEVNELFKALESVWPEFKISNKFLAESMKLKQLLFGGSVDNFTTADFEKGRSKVVRIKILIERFLPYYSIYAGEWDPGVYGYEESQKQFVASGAALEQTLKEAAALLEGPYDLQSLASFADEFDKLYPPEDGNGWGKLVKQFMPLVVDAKNMIFTGNDTVIRKEHWSVLASFGGRLFSDYLYYDYFIKDKPTDRLEVLLSMSYFSNQTLNILKDLVNQKKEGYFSKAELNKLVRHMVKLGIIPEGLSNDSINRLLDVVLNNMLVAPDRRLNGYSPNAFNVSAVEVARQELQILIDTQTWIARQTQNFKPDQGFRASSLIEAIEKAQRNKSLPQTLQIGLAEMLLSVSSPVPMVIDAKGRLEISNNKTHYYTADSLTRLNFTRGISRLLLRSFVNNRQRLATYSGATLQEVEAAFQKIRPIAVELDVLDPKNTTFASSRFREANIFVPHSDGNTLVSYTEMADLVQMIWSGLNLNTMLRGQLLKDCFGGRTKVKNSESVSLKCLRSSYRRSMPRYFTSLPEYLRYAGSISGEAWESYMDNIFKAAGHVPNNKGTATLEDISLSPHAMQYIEMLYARFDKNKDAILTTDESLRAFPAFKGILLDLAKDQIASGSIKEEDLLDLFTFILRYGKPPTTIPEKLRFVFKWRGKQQNWDVAADRGQLANILGYIADEASKAAVKNKPVKFDFNLEVSEGR